MKLLPLLLLSFFSLQVYAQHDHDISPTSGFEVTGSVKRSLKLSVNDLAAFRHDSLGDLIIKNKRGEQKGIARQLKGILLKTILDSAEIMADKPKDYSELIVTLVASDGYKNVYSWNELYNTEVGNHVYIITEMDSKPVSEIQDRILVISLFDFNSGRRHLKALEKIEIKKVL